MNFGTMIWRAVCGLASAHVASCIAASTGAGEQIAKNGTPAGVPACVVCHGATGQGRLTAGFPRLAGMNGDYLVKQLMSFKNGTRVNPVMAPVAKLLTASDQRAVAGYYAALPAVDEAAPVHSATIAYAAGQTLALRGAWSKGVPACAQCHGADGWGVGATFPKIAGQSAAYVASQLHAWQQGTRKNDPMGLMHGIAMKLTDTEISNVAAYYASQNAAPRRAEAKP